MSTVKLSSAFQVSIPQLLCELQHWQPGQEFAFIPKGKGVLLMPVPELSDLIGIAKGAGKKNIRDRKDKNNL